MSSRPPAATAHPSSIGKEELENASRVDPPTNEEIIAKLKKASHAGSIKEMVTIINQRVCPLRDDILRLLSQSSTSSATEFNRILPVGLLLKKANATTLARTWYGLSNCLFTLDGFTSGASSRLTRGDKQWLEKEFRPVLDIFRDSITVAVAEINADKVDSMRKSMVKLTERELKRKFLADGAMEPEDEAMRYCAVCRCRGTVDIPADNSFKAERNLGRMRQHSAEKAEWERKKASGDGERVGTSGITTRAPRLPTLEKLPIVCHCHQMRNPQPGVANAVGSTCRIKCTDEKGRIYDVDSTGKSTCPSCKCNCSAAYEVCDIEYHATRKLHCSITSFFIILVLTIKIELYHHIFDLYSIYKLLFN